MNVNPNKGLINNVKKLNPLFNQFLFSIIYNEWAQTRLSTELPVTYCYYGFFFLD